MSDNRKQKPEDEAREGQSQAAPLDGLKDFEDLSKKIDQKQIEAEKAYEDFFARNFKQDGDASDKTLKNGGELSTDGDIDEDRTDPRMASIEPASSMQAGDEKAETAPGSIKPAREATGRESLEGLAAQSAEAAAIGEQLAFGDGKSEIAKTETVQLAFGDGKSEVAKTETVQLAFGDGKSEIAETETVQFAFAGEQDKNSTVELTTRSDGQRDLSAKDGVEQLAFPGEEKTFVDYLSSSILNGRGLMDSVRQFTGKMAALAGYNPPPPQPPAPYMDIQRWAGEVPIEKQYKDQRWRRSRTTRVAYYMRKRREREKQGVSWFWIGATAVLLMLVIFGSFGGSAYGYSAYQQEYPQVAALAQKTITQNTRIYDRSGVLLYESYDTNDPAKDPNAGRRVPITLDDVPLVMQNAMIATEDNTFWTNAGVDPQAIVRAGLLNNGSGGSTITQQVIKNLTNNSDHTWQRKAVEATMALALTQQYTKKQILNMYFNIAAFGIDDKGVETATESLFNLPRTCDLKTDRCDPAISKIGQDSNGKADPLLGLARASILAGIPNNPSLYDPRLDQITLNRMLGRQDTVLKRMMAQGMTVDGTVHGQPITNAIIKQVESMTKKMTFKPYGEVKQAPYFVDWVMFQMARALDPDGVADGYADGYTKMQTAGLNIYTTVDANLEQYVEDAVQANLYHTQYQLFPTADAGFKVISQALNVNDGAVVVEAAKTGEILAMDGGADYYNATNQQEGGNYNTAAPPDDGNGYDPTNGGYVAGAKQQTISPNGRPPGSTMKPIIYAAAFEDGWNPDTIVPDQMTFFPNGQGAGTAIPTGSAVALSPIDDQGDLGYPNVGSAAAAVGLYAPTDYGQTYHNTLTGNTATIYYQTANSYNVPALRAMSYVGSQNVMNMAQRMGIDTLHEGVNGIDGITWAIGALNVPLIQMVGAYQVFANNGTHIAPVGITDILDNYGHSLFHYDPNHPNGTRVLSPQVAFMITSILRDQYDRFQEFGLDPDLSFGRTDQSCFTQVVCDNQQMAAKTGTSDSFDDNMTLGYTPDVVVGVWAGNVNDSPMKQGTVGITGAAPIFSDIMNRMLIGCPDNLPDLGQTYPYSTEYAAFPTNNHGVGDCGTKFNLPFTGHPTLKFTAPAGMTQTSENAINGLQGAGLPPAYMLPNQVPTQSGLN